MDKEKLIKSIMKDLDCTREDAEEIAEMEIKAKGIKRYEKAEEQKPRKKRVIKLDEDKIKIINFLERILTDSDALQVEIKNVQKEITFKFNGADYSLTLTKHRPPKK